MGGGGGGCVFVFVGGGGWLILLATQFYQKLVKTNADPFDVLLFLCCHVPQDSKKKKMLKANLIGFTLFLILRFSVDKTYIKKSHL